jgi:hypothetical protein
VKWKVLESVERFDEGRMWGSYRHRQKQRLGKRGAIPEAG